MSSLPPKSVWTDDDLGSSSLHDCFVHGFCADADGFRVAPARLSFENASLVQFQIEPGQGIWQVCGFSRSDPRRVGPAGELVQWQYKLAGHDGELTVSATSFKLQLRAAPSTVQSQGLSWSERGGCSFI